MGLELPPRARRVGLLTAGSAGLLLLGACSAEDQDQIRRLAMPEPATDRAPHIYDLWHGSWLAAIIVGVLVWGLIGWAAFKYRRRSDDEIPVQTRYNLPIEILYTVAPIVIVLVFFYYTVTTQNRVLEDASGEGSGGQADRAELEGVRPVDRRSGRRLGEAVSLEDEHASGMEPLIDVQRQRGRARDADRVGHLGSVPRRAHGR